MTQTIVRGYKAMLDEANAAVETIAAADAVKQFQPYDRIQEPLPALRADLVRLVTEAHRRRVEAFILANNRAEGNAPGTIRAVARMWQEGDLQGTS